MRGRVPRRRPRPRRPASAGRRRRRTPGPRVAGHAKLIAAAWPAPFSRHPLPASTRPTPFLKTSDAVPGPSGAVLDSRRVDWINMSTVDPVNTTFNTINRLADGVSDTVALGPLNPATLHIDSGALRNRQGTTHPARDYRTRQGTTAPGRQHRLARSTAGTAACPIAVTGLPSTAAPLKARWSWGPTSRGAFWNGRPGHSIAGH